MPSIDLAFRLTGSAVPVDHGYALYAALSRILPEIHAAKDVGVQPIRDCAGYRQPARNGRLHPITTVKREQGRLLVRPHKTRAQHRDVYEEAPQSPWLNNSRAESK